MRWRQWPIIKAKWLHSNREDRVDRLKIWGHETWNASLTACSFSKTGGKIIYSEWVY